MTPRSAVDELRLYDLPVAQGVDGLLRVGRRGCRKVRTTAAPRIATKKERKELPRPAPLLAIAGQARWVTNSMAAGVSFRGLGEGTPRSACRSPRPGRGNFGDPAARVEFRPPLRRAARDTLNTWICPEEAGRRFRISTKISPQKKHKEKPVKGIQNHVDRDRAPDRPAEAVCDALVLTLFAKPTSFRCERR